MRSRGEITCLEQIVKPYCLHYRVNSTKRLLIAVRSLFQFIFSRLCIAKVSNDVQKVTREHRDHYSVGIDVDVQAVMRGVSTEKKLMRLARSMSASIDRHRPWKITLEV